MIELSLSGRLIEIQYHHCEMDVPDFMSLAGQCGYGAVELRSTQITMDMAEEERRRIRAAVDELRVGVSSVFMPPDIPADQTGLQLLEEFADRVRTLGGVTLKSWDSDVDWIQRECDMLRSLGMELIVQTHTGGPFETVDLCLDALKRINRDNFGLQYDPANFFEANQDYGQDAIMRLGKHIRQLSVQDCRLACAEDKDAWEHEGRHFARVLPGDPGGLDYGSVFRGLEAVEFDGHAVINAPSSTQMEPALFARRALDGLREFID